MNNDKAFFESAKVCNSAACSLSLSAWSPRCANLVFLLICYCEPIFTWPPCPVWFCCCTNSKGALLCGWLAGFLTLRLFKISRTLLSANTYSKMHVFMWLLSSMHCTSQSVQLQCSASVWIALPMAKQKECGKSKRVLVYTDEQNIHKIRQL